MQSGLDPVLIFRAQICVGCCAQIRWVCHLYHHVNNVGVCFSIDFHAQICVLMCTGALRPANPDVQRHVAQRGAEAGCRLPQLTHQSHHWQC